MYVKLFCVEIISGPSMVVQAVNDPLGSRGSKIPVSSNKARPDLHQRKRQTDFLGLEEISWMVKVFIV